jgi:outer membrane protein, heavy metal efflux system
MLRFSKCFASRPVFYSGWSACFSSKLLPIIILDCLLLLISQLSFPVSSTAQVTLDEALRIARESNPDLSEVARELIVANGEIQRANYFSQFNPKLDADADYRMRDDSSGSQDWRVGVSQELEIFGQPGLRRESASLSYQERRAELNDHLRMLNAAVEMSFYDALRHRRQIELLDELQSLDARLLKAAQSRMMAGDISQIELNLAQVSYGQTQLAAVAELERYRLQRSSLGRLLGGKVGREPQPSGRLEPTPIDANLDDLVERARLHRPDLEARFLEISRLSSEQALNQRLALPNPTIGVFGGHELNAEHFVGGTLSIPIPVFDRRQAESTALVGRTEQAKDQLMVTRLDVEREVYDAYYAYQTANKSLQIYQDQIIGPATESFNLLERAFTSGKIDLLRLAVTERAVYEARRGYLDASFNLVAAQVSIDLATGGI